MLFGAFSAFLVVTVSASVIFEDCGSAYDLEEVKIDGCSMRLPCYVTLGEEIPVSLAFYADFPSAKLDQDVVLNINHLNLNTDVTPDSCSTVSCPVTTNARTSFTSIMSVPSRVALNQRGYLNWRVYNERGRLVICYSVLVQTQSPVQKKLRLVLSQMASQAVDKIVDKADPEIPSGNFTQNYLRNLVDQYNEIQRLHLNT